MGRFWVAAVMVGILAVPASNASWRGVGTLEPDYLADASGNYMFEHPDTLVQPSGIYFDAYVAFEQLTLNPNVATLGGRFLAPGAVHHRAMLGIWKDCNRDGYIGLAESAVQDYHASLIPTTGICAVDSPFNDGKWVSEMIMIGMVDPCEYKSADVRASDCGNIPEFHDNPRVIYAPGTMVWGDAGEPGQVPHAECAMPPLPAGSMTGTGAMVGAIDCLTDRAVANTVNAVDPANQLGLRFDDPEHPENSTSLLNQRLPVTLWGSSDSTGVLQAGSGSPSATAWDCEQPRGTADVANPLPVSEVPVDDPSRGKISGRQTTIVGSFVFFADEDNNDATPGVMRIKLTDGGSSIAWAPTFAPNVNERGSAWDAAEELVDGPRGDCDSDTTSPLRATHPKRFIEGDRDQVDEGKKDRTSLAFTFYDGHRGLNDNVDFLLGDTAPADGGLVYRRNDRGGDGPFWSADTMSVQEPQLVTRRGAQPDGTIHFTYYARIGDDPAVNFFRLPGGKQEYGFDACGGGVADRNGWVCDPTRWWLDDNGESARPSYFDGTPYAPIPGTEYQLRDVDCYDGAIARGQPVHASLAQFDENGMC